MKQLLLVTGLLALTYGCSFSPSPYITECEQPECELQAAEKGIEAAHIDGVQVIINGDFSMALSGPVQSLIHQNDIVVIALPNEAKVAAATLSVDDHGLENTELSASTILDLAFMDRFSAFPHRLTAEEKHTIRAIKLDAMSGDNAVKYVVGDLGIYFYSESDTKHKAYVVVGEKTQSWVMIDFYGLVPKSAKEMLFTIDVL